MIEIRTLHAPETERFLELLCSVFNLDVGRARSIFYNEPFYDLNRKWAVFQGGEMVSILTTVPLQFGWGAAVGIAGVATRADRQRQGLAARLVQCALEEERARGVQSAYLFARDTRLYERCGFEKLDEAIYAPIQGTPEFILPRTLSFDEASALYADWASADRFRLIRDARRWSFWKWNLRVCSAHTTGYLCLEGNTVREVVPGGGDAPWPVPVGAEWFGLASMAAQAGVPISNPRVELSFMGWRSPGMPQFFLTDQF